MWFVGEHLAPVRVAGLGLVCTGLAALRETGVLFGAVIGALAFREPFGRSRVVAAALVAAGVVLLNV